MGEGSIVPDPVGTNRATTARLATLGIGKDNRLGVCKIWTYKRVSRFCQSEISDSEQQTGLQSLKGGLWVGAF